MALVRRELGAEALILGTRRVVDGVEITAALEPREARPLETSGRGQAAALVYHAVPDRLRGALSFGDFPTALAGALPFGTLPFGDAPLLLTGPPGAGKTLTVVRLATRMVLRGQKPMVVAADGNKAGATEQLRAFTRLLGLTMTVADEPLTLARALAQREENTPVLIDAPGSNPFDPAESDALRALISAVGARVAVVLPAGLDPAEAADTATAYADAGAEFLVATRLDVARRLGGIVAAAEAARLILTEAGIGPNAADGLVPMTPDFLAARLLRTGNLRHAA